MLGPLARYLFRIDSGDGLHPEVSAGIGGHAFPPIGELLRGPQDDVVRLRKRFVLAELHAIAVHAFYRIPTPFNEVRTGGRKPEIRWNAWLRRRGRRRGRRRRRRPARLGAAPRRLRNPESGCLRPPPIKEAGSIRRHGRGSAATSASGGRFAYPPAYYGQLGGDAEDRESENGGRQRQRAHLLPAGGGVRFAARSGSDAHVNTRGLWPAVSPGCLAVPPRYAVPSCRTPDSIRNTRSQLAATWGLWLAMTAVSP